MQVFVIANADKNKFRSWNELGPSWTEAVIEALWFARKHDAEQMCLTDEDAWHVIPIDPVLETIRAAHLSVPGGQICDPQKIADELLDIAKRAGANLLDV